MLQILTFTMIFLTGLVVGSFLNSVIYRLHEGKSFLRGRSYCPHCKHKLSWQDLIPLFSFLILKGRCRYCHQKISLQYPLVELATGILFVLLFYYTTYDIRYTIYNLIISCFLVIIFVYDLKYYIIPDKIIYPAIGITFLYRLFETLKFGNLDLIRNWKLEIGNLQPLLNSLGAAFLASAFFLAIVLVSHAKWMGMGDFKLAFFMGLFLGFPNILVALFLSFFIGAIIGIALIISGKRSLKSEIPFGPFLVTGTFLALFWTKQIINWYLNIFI